MLEQESSEKPEEEKLEGYDDPAEDTAGYPLDSLFIRQETRSVSDALSRVKSNRWILDPDFQRDFVWPADKQSRLIESCIMRIPLPVFYVAEGPGGEIVIVDGLQRITTFSRYVNNEFKIQGIGEEENHESPITGKFFRELPLKLQERILDTQLIMYILDANAPDRARLDIFERVNSGVPLSRQQMRNAIYSGPATRWLKKVVESDLFLDATGRSLNTKNMRDRETVNRFCAFSIFGVEEYRGDMDDFLASALKYMNDPKNETHLNALGKGFMMSLISNRNIFGKHAFRKSLVDGDYHAQRTIFNISLFDVCAVLLAKFPEEISHDSVLGKSIRNELVQLIQAEGVFWNSISYSTNNTKVVKARFNLAEKAFLKHI